MRYLRGLRVTSVAFDKAACLVMACLFMLLCTVLAHAMLPGLPGWSAILLRASLIAGWFEWCRRLHQD